MNKLLILWFCACLAACSTTAELEARAQRVAAAKAQEIAQQEATKLAEEKRAKDRAAKQEADDKREAAQKHAMLIQAHRANGGFVIVTVSKTCLSKPNFQGLLSHMTLADMVTAPRCLLYSSSDATIRASYLNDTKTSAKDLQFQCTLTAKSGTALVVGKPTVIYELWAPGQIREFELEVPQHAQMKSATCRKL